MTTTYRLLMMMAGAILVVAGIAFYLEPPHRWQPNQINGITWLVAAVVAGGAFVPNLAIASFTPGWKAPELVAVGGIVTAAIFGAVLAVWG